MKDWRQSLKQLPPSKLSAAILGCLASAAFTAQAQPDYAPAIWKQAYAGHWYTSGNGHQFCVIHDMEGYYLATISYIQGGGGNDKVSINYCVNGLKNGSDSQGHAENRPDDSQAGEITQMVREQYYAYHVGCWNEWMFGTEHEGWASNPAWYSEAMYQASAGLQRHLCDNYGIPKDRNHIIAHGEWQNSAWKTWMAANYASINTSCNTHTDPGIYWNWGHFMQLITNAPTITAHPANVTASAGSNATFSVVAVGPGPLHYQWLLNSTQIAGATASTYTRTNVQVQFSGSYSVVVTNSYGSTTSSNAFLSVISTPTNAPGAIPAPPGMVDWWTGQGNCRDSFGNYHGTPIKGFTFVAGKTGLGFHFDGSSGVVNIGAPTIPPPWTASMWVNRQNAPGASAALLSDGTYTFKLEQYNGTRKVGVTKLGVGDYVFNYTVPTGIWMNLVFVGTSSNTMLYANGVLVDTITNSVSLPRAYIGAGYITSPSMFVDFMLGSLDEIMLFNRTLSQAEISSIYSAGSPGFLRAPAPITPTYNAVGKFALGLKGQTGKNFTIYGSTNLIDWTAIATLVNPTGTNIYTDPNASSFPNRFYRVSQ
jgi:Concanavalin A-like lectin/glucanases superfamily/N-acetylmuramoyl-L-alanine amidase/Immunoglobulin domain